MNTRSPSDAGRQIEDAASIRTAYRLLTVEWAEPEGSQDLKCVWGTGR